MFCVPIKGYNRKYFISRCGRIFNKNFKELSPYVNERGYLNIKLYKNGKYKHFKLHQLVAKVFIPNPKRLPQVNHKDGDKLNNCVSNLEWISNKDNQVHKWMMIKRKRGCLYEINNCWKS